MKTQFWIICALVVALLWCLFFFKQSDQPEIAQVMCDKGDSLASRLADGKPGQTFVLTGTCKEDQPVIIDKDGMTIIGGKVIGGPDRAAVTVTAKNVTIKGLTASESRHGIVVRENASIDLQNVSAIKNEYAGLCILGKRTNKKKSYQTPPSSSSRFIVDDKDRCMARVNPRYKRPEAKRSYPESKSKPVSSSGILDFLVPKAMAAACGSVNRGCNTNFSLNGYGLWLDTDVGTPNPSALNFVCSTPEIISGNRVGGIAALGGSTLCTENSTLHVIGNNLDGLYAENSNFSFNDSIINSSGHESNIFIENGSTVTCNSSTVNHGGSLTNLGSSYDTDC